MAEDSSSNITYILTSYESFINILENSNWIQTAKIEDIKTAFKLGNFIEKTTDHFRNQNSLEKFFSVLAMWLKKKNRTKVYSENIYSRACDELVIKFFSSTNISEMNLDIAVRVYTSLFPKKRFEDVLIRLLLNAGNLEALSEYMTNTFNDSDSKCLEYNLTLQKWDSMIKKGLENNVKAEVKDMLTPYNVETFLHVLIGVLSLTKISKDEKGVQDIVLNSVLEKMQERSILTKQLWSTLFKSLETKIVCQVCKNFPTFLNDFLSFIVYIGSMMNKIETLWKSDPDICFYPDIEYEDILTYISQLCKYDSIKQTIFTKLNEAKQFTDTDIWNQIVIHLEK